MAGAAINMTITGGGGGGGGGGGIGGCGTNLSSSSSQSSETKTISRLLQHSILQLCNEHIAYSNKLQILGVICMTIDDEQQELTIKVNNTLKRVSPPPTHGVQNGGGGAKDLSSPRNSASSASSMQSPSQSAFPTNSQSAIGSTSLFNGDHQRNQNNNSNGMDNDKDNTAAHSLTVPHPLLASVPGYSVEGLHEEDTTTPASASSRSSPAVPAENGRKTHGRKGSKPMRVDHVYDEGDTIDEGDGNILTVIPTDPADPDPDSVRNGGQSVYMEQESDDDDDELMEDDLDEEYDVNDEDEEDEAPPPPKAHQRNSPRSPRQSASSTRKASSSVPKSTASPSVRALLQQSIARKGSNMEPQTTPLALTSSSSSSSSQQQQQYHSQLRTALMNGTHAATSSSCLTLPICVAPRNMNGHGTDDGESSPGRLHIDEDEAHKQDMDDSGVSIKEEPKDEYDFSGAGEITSPILSSSNTSMYQPYFMTSGMEGVSSLPTYSGLSLALTTANLVAGSMNTTTNHDHMGGLSIRYTPTGPITVGANGKNVSRPSSVGGAGGGGGQKVKDIILYDDQSPLSQQKGARLETDFMVDKMGVEGRKRRRRAPDECLTTEEIAEYMGVNKDADPHTIGHGTFGCKYCPLSTDEVVSYLQHTLAVHNAYICHQCGKSFTTKSSLLRHRPIHTGQRRFSCSICKKTFYRKDKCKAHIKRHLGEEGANASGSPGVVE